MSSEIEKNIKNNINECSSTIIILILLLSKYKLVKLFFHKIVLIFSIYSPKE